MYDKLEAFEEFEYGYTLKVTGDSCFISLISARSYNIGNGLLLL